ncbi:galactokinase [Nostocoides sp. F2B08]|uniref:galactokinase n=1 Tax=Nostocoides sp. F2B08 TaxID=2653936 RepID=UPI001262B873|nr:galactokinase [Tetrasphaera sp. F2B08]KAB7743808.1 galactokinase [Tetrasphaera sp. F2B08]
MTHDALPSTAPSPASLLDTFESLHGRPADGVWSAPGRVNLIGEHTDYVGGLVLPIALPQRTVAACARRGDDLVRVHSATLDQTAEIALGEVGPGSPGGWPSYAAGVLWALREAGHEVGGIDAVIDSSVPVGAGLSSSAALECAVGAAVSDLFDLALLADDTARRELIAACIRAENDVAGAATGGMDQSAALLCRPGHALYLDCRSGEVEHIPFDLEDHGLVLLVTDTRAAHTLADGQYEVRRRAAERAAERLGLATLRDVDPHALDEALETLAGDSPGDRPGNDELVRRARHVVTEIDRVRATVAALREDDFDTVGELFTTSHVSLRDDFEVSCAELDLAVETALGAGALGARMTGGGFGGSSIALVPAEAAAHTADLITAAYADRGWSAPHSFAVTAGGAARRDL